MEPTITFLFNHNGSDTPTDFNGTNTPSSPWVGMQPSTSTLVATGGGILGTITDLSVSGTRDATIKPSISPYKIPQYFVEQDDYMYLTTCGYNVNRYCMGVFVYGDCASDIYAECWDDNTFSTTDLELLQGTTNNGGNSMVNLIRTTDSEPEWPWSGSSSAAAYLRGTEHRVGLKNSSTISNECLYFNWFIELPTDCSTFHCQSVLAFRYLYT